MTIEAFFSCDIESDGDIPGPYSMVSIGMAVCGLRLPGGQLVRYDAVTARAEDSFYAELRPISEQWDPEALAVSGLSREHLVAEGRDPQAAMADMVSWVDARTESISARYDGEKVRAVFVAYPLGFDWMFAYWYMKRFAGRSPFGHSTHIDIKTEYASRGHCSIIAATKRQMPSWLLGKGPHTHNALDDAIEQGEMLMNILRWRGRDHWWRPNHKDGAT